MRFALTFGLILSAPAVLAFEPGTHGEATEEEGYFAGCVTSEETGSACVIHARGAVFLASSEGPSEPDAMNALAVLEPGTAVKFTGDMVSMGDITVEFALNTAAENPSDPLAPLVMGLQGSWSRNGADVTITGLEWIEAEVSYLISLGSSCSDGVERGTTHLSLYQMGGDPFTSICLEVVDQAEATIQLRDVETGIEAALTR